MLSTFFRVIEYYLYFSTPLRAFPLILGRIYKNSSRSLHAALSLQAVIINKEGKDKEETNAYRLIPLTSTRGKILEKFILSKLDKELEEHKKVLHQNQFA